MPEMLFSVRWPDGTAQRCYSPSLVVKDYLEPGRSYRVGEFVTRTRSALTIASERVRGKYGFACTSAAAELAAIEHRAASFEALGDDRVVVEAFEEVGAGAGTAYPL